MTKRKENLQKYVVRKRTPSQRKKGIDGYLYFQRAGEPSVKFECQDTNDPQFAMEYALLLTGKKQREIHNPQLLRKTFTALVASYNQTSQYAALKPSTAKDYDKANEYIKRAFGDVNPAKVQRHHVIEMFNANREKLRFANHTVQSIRILFEHAIDKGWMNHNPAQGVKFVKRNNPSRLPWPDDLLIAYQETATERALLVFEMCLATGQRIQDVLDMKWSDIRPIDGTVGVHLVQNKTGKLLWIPLRDSLVTLLSNTKRKGETILVNRHATGPWSYRGASQAVMNVRKEIGAEKYDIQSLRYNAACDLALAGLDDIEIGSVTGQTTQTVQHYTKSVRQMANAKRAINAREKMLAAKREKVRLENRR
jgi:integrase